MTQRMQQSKKQSFFPAAIFWHKMKKKWKLPEYFVWLYYRSKSESFLFLSESCDRNGYFNVVKLPKHMSGEEAEHEVKKQLDAIWDLIEEVPESQETAMLISGRALEIAIGQEIFFKLMTQ